MMRSEDHPWNEVHTMYIASVSPPPDTRSFFWDAPLSHGHAFAQTMEAAVLGRPRSQYKRSHGLVETRLFDLNWGFCPRELMWSISENKNYCIISHVKAI
jgi:hypothetical protein